MEDVLSKLKKGEYLEYQRDSTALEDTEINRIMSPKHISMSDFKDIYLEVLDGEICVTYKVEISEAEFNKEHSLLSDIVVDAASKVNHAASLIRKIMYIDEENF